MVGFNGCGFLKQVSIPESVERINGFNSILVKDSMDKDWEEWIDEHDGDTKFIRYCGIREVHFLGDSQLNSIEGFNGCVDLKRINIPASVERLSGFHGLAWMSRNSDHWIDASSGLVDIRFCELSQLRELKGLDGGEKLITIDIPASVEILYAFEGIREARTYEHSVRLKAVIFTPDSRLLEIHGFTCCDMMKGFGIITPVDDISWGPNGLFFETENHGLKGTLMGLSPNTAQAFSTFAVFPFLKRIEVPAYVQVINELDFYLCKSLKDIVFD
jgi:hypothetical protein